LALLLQSSFQLQKRKNIMKDQSKVIAALLVGAAAGAVLGLLFAPDSGEATRGSLAGYADDVVGKAKDKARTATDSLKEYGATVADKVKSKYSEAVNDLYNYRDGVSEDISLKTDEVQAAADDQVNNAKSKVKSAADDLNDQIQQA
jgi:gas vesicle protein